MICALSGTTPVEPAVSSRSGHVFEKRLILKYLEANDDTCPVTKQPLKPEDLIDIKVNKNIVPRPTTATSIPSMLALFQNEWDAVMMETYTLKQQLESVRQELAHALYQHDAACRVIARLIKERDEARNTLANFRSNSQAASNETPEETMEVEAAVNNISEEIREKMQAKSQELAKDRKKREISGNLETADNIKGFTALSSVTLHKTTNPGIKSLDIHPVEQSKIVTGGIDGDVILYDRDEGKIASKLTGHKKRVNDVLFHPSQDIIFSCSADNTARAFGGSNNTYKAHHIVKVHKAEVVGCSLQATGNYWVTASADQSWAFHDIETAETITQVSTDSACSCVSFHPDGLIVATGLVDSTVKIWDIKTQKSVANFEGHKGKVVDLSFSENGYYLATAAEDDTIKLWDLRKLKSVQSTDLPEGFGVTSLDFDYSGSYLAVAGSDVRVFIGKTFNHVATFSKHTGSVNAVKWGADAKFLASGSSDRTLKIWGLK